MSRPTAHRHTWDRWNYSLSKLLWSIMPTSLHIFSSMWNMLINRKSSRFHCFGNIVIAISFDCCVLVFLDFRLAIQHIVEDDEIIYKVDAKYKLKVFPVGNLGWRWISIYQTNEGFEMDFFVCCLSTFLRCVHIFLQNVGISFWGYVVDADVVVVVVIARDTFCIWIWSGFNKRHTLE